ncbi:hypothetical protein [Sphingomonas sp.]|uniref:hypothetical protein n=1 Tax=Sphingomonas sp. TaxID=28214 RepID=UPI002FDB517D
MPKSFTLKICALAIVASAAESGLSIGIGDRPAAFLFFGLSMTLALLTVAAYPLLTSGVSKARDAE